MSHLVSAPEIHHNSEEVLKKDPFVHLHLHSVYSLLDGAIGIKDLVSHVKSLGMDSVAVTDHGNMFGAIEFYSEAVKNNIKPIIGCEFYIAPSRFEKKSKDDVNDGGAYHFVLLAKNKTGYKNLIKLSSKAYIEGFYKKPRIDYKLLSEYSEGLVGLSGCLAGEINRKILRKESSEALNLAVRLNEILGKGNFYLELQKHGIADQEIAAKGLIEIHKKTGIPLVVSNDAHFLRKEDRDAQDIMLRIQMQKKIDEPMTLGFNQEFYVKSGDEMRNLFPEFPEAASNTRLIADMINLEMQFDTPLLPDFKTPDGISLADYLDKLSFDGLKKRFNGREIPAAYTERLKTELSVIHKMGFEGYFLIVSDFISYAKNSNIPVGPGRGSAAGSMTAYCLEITNIDPIRYGLLFERFLNPSRNEMPDIDIDFCRDKREDVINYVVNKYGVDHVSQIITFGTLSAKAVIKDVARVMGFDFSEINALCKNIPDTPGLSLENAISESNEAKQFFSRGEKEKKLWHTAKTLEGVPRNSGKHAAGIVIAPCALDEIIPLAVDTKTGSVISQFEKGSLEKAGLVKMDLLGLKNLTIIQKTIDEIKKRRGIKVEIDKLPLDDKAVYELLQKGKTKGIFQVENSGMTKMLKRAKPQKFEDIIACVALYRPGPLQSGMTEEYIKRRNGEVKVTYPHKDLEPILNETYGTIVYQEQVMMISRVVGGFSMAEADTLRKAMGKKKMDVMEKLKAQFTDGAKKKGHNEKWASQLFDMMAEFGKYGFNKSHSAAYGLITYQTAYLKAHYPVEFIKANLDADIETSEKLIGTIQSAKEMGIEILPPHINKSNLDFTILSDNKLIYGLLGVKGLGKLAVDAMLEARREKPFDDIFDFAGRVESKHLNRKSLEALTFSGSLDCFGKSRAFLYENMEIILSFGNKAQLDKAMGQESLFETSEVRPVSYYTKDITEWSSGKKLLLEKQTLGLYLTAHPVDSYKEMLAHSSIVPISEIDDEFSKERQVKILAVIDSVKIVNSKRGTSFCALTISDLTGSLECRVYNTVYEKHKEIIKENNIVLINMKVSIFRDEETSRLMVTANNFSIASELEKFVEKSLHIYMSSGGNITLREQVVNIKKILSGYPGESPVFIHYKNHENNMQVVRVHPMYYVNHTEDINNNLRKTLVSDEHFVWRVGNKVYISSEVQKAI
ncbi:MAG: DNA polymerase III subunit alpha [Spirochaetia bacterium]|nr:DNA polymerase III subunit alpha [Spirochaetia bacterium]